MEQKTCECCGLELVRKRSDSGRLEDLTIFKRRRFCGHSCANTRRDVTKSKKAAAIEQQQTVKTSTLSPLDSQEKQTAIKFLMQVVENDAFDTTTRVTAAKALLPYQSKKVDSSIGKKEEQAESAKKAVTGRFAPASGPKIFQIKRQVGE